MSETVDMFSVDSKPVQGWLKKAASIAPPVSHANVVSPDVKKIVLCMTPRSGSTYLGSIMRENGLGNGREHFRVAGNTMEKFVRQNSVSNYDEYVSAMMKAQSHEGVFNLKADWLQYSPVYYFGAHSKFFREADFIYLTRSDILMQAISRYVSTETGFFHTGVNADKAHTLEQEIPMDFDKISFHLRHLIQMQAAWEMFFSHEGIAPLRVVYEEVDSNPASVLQRISDYVKKPLPETLTLKTEFEVVRNERNERLREQFVDASRRRLNSVAGSFEISGAK